MQARRGSGAGTSRQPRPNNAACQTATRQANETGIANEGKVDVYAALVTGRCGEAKRDEKGYLHTREASGLADSEAHRRDDSLARLGGARTHRPSSAVAQRNAQSTSGASAWGAAAVALEGSWATEPLTCGGPSSDLRGGGGAC